MMVNVKSMEKKEGWPFDKGLLVNMNRSSHD